MNISKDSRFTQWLLVALSALTIALSGWFMAGNATYLTIFSGNEPVQFAGPVGDNGGG